MMLARMESHLRHVTAEQLHWLLYWTRPRREFTKVQEKWLDALEVEQREIVFKVVGAVKYADLAQNLATDYRFDWDKLLAAEEIRAIPTIYLGKNSFCSTWI